MDKALVEQAQRGSERAFEALVATVGDRLYTSAYYILRDTTAAEDATQQALVEIWRHLPSLRDRARFRPWAFRILVRAAYAEERRNRRGGPKLLLLDDFAAQAGTDSPAGVDLHDQLERGFKRLKSSQRAVVVLKHYAGFSDAEIADLRSLPEGTVRSTLHRSIAALRAALEADDRSSDRRETA